MRNILLVEDSLADIALIEAVIREKFIDVELRCVRDGAAALETLVDGRAEDMPDLVLLDLNLPRLNGLDVLRAMKRHELSKGIPVVMMSNSCSAEDVRKAYQLQASAFIRKPFDLEHFEMTMRVMMSYWFEIVSLPDLPFERRNAVAAISGE